MESVQEPRKATICILDDDHAARDELRSLLEAAGYNPIFFADKRALLDEIQRRAPSCVCLRYESTADADIVLAELAQFCIPAFIVSRQGDIPTAVKMIRAGASDFISGQVDGQEIVRRIELVLAEFRETTRTTANLAGRRLPELQSLSSREAHVLAQVAKGLSSKEIATVLGISWRTVDHHRASILQKLGARNTAELMIVLMNKAAGLHSSH